MSATHHLAYSHRSTLAERCFWRSHPSSGSREALSFVHQLFHDRPDEPAPKLTSRQVANLIFAASGSNILFTVNCECGAAGRLLNSQFGHRETITMNAWMPKHNTAGWCPVVMDELGREMVAAVDVADDFALNLSDGEERRLAEEFKVQMDAEHAAIMKERGGA